MPSKRYNHLLIVLLGSLCFAAICRIVGGDFTIRPLTMSSRTLGNCNSRFSARRWLKHLKCWVFHAHHSLSSERSGSSISSRHHFSSFASCAARSFAFNLSLAQLYPSVPFPALFPFLYPLPRSI